MVSQPPFPAPHSRHLKPGGPGGPPVPGQFGSRPLPPAPPPPVVPAQPSSPDGSSPTPGPQPGPHPGGGFIAFLGTLPGILTAVAALITAVTGVLLARPTASPQPPPPASDVRVDPERLISNIEQATLATPADALVQGCATGSADACGQLLDALAQECYDGLGLSCDVLYWVSPVGSVYEDYGATCGGLFSDWTSTGRCSEESA